MKILFLTTAHNSLSQRLLIELTQRGHTVPVAIAESEGAMLRAVDRENPDLIVAPMLKATVPEAIWANRVCLIVHPGIVGDRGPSSLDWAIQDGETRWGVTVLQAAAEMDAGPIWASHEFPLPAVADSICSFWRCIFFDHTLPAIAPPTAPMAAPLAALSREPPTTAPSTAPAPAPMPAPLAVSCCVWSMLAHPPSGSTAAMTRALHKVFIKHLL
jgi:hypothetical protein